LRSKKKDIFSKDNYLNILMDNNLVVFFAFKLENKYVQGSRKEKIFYL